jgi:hypothetical protein
VVAHLLPIAVKVKNGGKFLLPDPEPAADSDSRFDLDEMGDGAGEGVPRSRLGIEVGIGEGKDGLQYLRPVQRGEVTFVRHFLSGPSRFYLNGNCPVTAEIAVTAGSRSTGYVQVHDTTTR